MSFNAPRFGFGIGLGRGYGAPTQGGGDNPTLNPLTVTPNSATVGTVYNGSVAGRTVGSTLTLTGAGAAGLSIDSGTGAITGTPSSAGAVNVVETLSGAIGSPRTSNGVVAVEAASTLPPPAARVAISDAYYSVGDASYVNALKLASVNKTQPFPGTLIPANSVGHVSIKHAPIYANSPALLVEMLSGGNTSSVKVFVSYDSVDGSPGSGTWYDETAYFPIFSPSSNTWTRGQRYFWRPNSDHVTAGFVGATADGQRWERVEFTTTSSSANPLVVPSSGEWYLLPGMSIVRNAATSTAYNTMTNAFKACVPGSDPFLFVTALTGANADVIKTAQIDVVAASPYYKKHIRGVYIDAWINEIANTSRRPFSGMTESQKTEMQGRLNACYDALKAALPLCPVFSPNVGYGNYVNAQYSPNMDVPSAISDPKGNDRFLQFFWDVLRVKSPISVDPAYGWPYMDQFATMCQNYDTDLSDDIHWNSTGYTKMRTGANCFMAPAFQIIAGVTVTANNWIMRFISDLGATPTAAKKARALAIFDLLDQTAYPTANAIAISNRAARRAEIAALTTSG